MTFWEAYSDFRVEWQVTGREAKKMPLQPFRGRMGSPRLGDGLKVQKGTKDLSVSQGVKQAECRR